LTEDRGASASELTDGEQKTQTARLAAMRRIVGSLIDFEDRKKRGMSWTEIVALPGLGDSNSRKAIDDLQALKYVVCATVSGVEETSGDVRINRLCELYGTTFFGRKWLIDLENE
jgi:hypothetical protein